MSGSKWVALATFTDDQSDSDDPFLFEEGRVYDYDPDPRTQWAPGSRQLEPDELTAACPRCGEQFAASDGHTAAANRNFHFNGDEGLSSICRVMPNQRRFTVVPKDGAR